VERKLTAILCADVYGYSRLMGEDEEGTLRTLSASRKITDSLIERHHGRFVNSAGDSVLAEFSSVVEAVTCAVTIQTALRAENAQLPLERRMQFRIGVNLGDVMVEGQQIYGDGVNVAARLESLAEPGGICISRSVHENVRNKLPLNFEDLGEQAVKNIAEPVHVWRVLLDGTPAVTQRERRIQRRYWRGGVLSLTGLVIAIGTIVLVQHLSLRPPHTHASIQPPQSPLLALPREPSIAVLPFVNLSGDPKQDYFSDGLTEYLIDDLSRLPGLFVIARNSTFVYKGKAVSVAQVGRDLGVRLVLEGSVLKAGNQVRISAELADAASGTNMWAVRLDRPLQDIFAMQDEVVTKIVTTINLMFQLRSHGVPAPSVGKFSIPGNLDAFDYYLRGLEYQYSFTKQGNDKAGEMYERAIKLAPDYLEPYVSLGIAYWLSWGWGWNQQPNTMDRVAELAQAAAAINDANPGVQMLLAVVDLSRNHQYAQAIAHAKRSIDLDPNYLAGYVWLAETLTHAGRGTDAVGWAEKATRLDPLNRSWYLLEVGQGYAVSGQYAQAAAALKEHLASYPNSLGARAVLAVSYVELGQEQEARAQVAEIRRISPQMSLGVLKERAALQDAAFANRFYSDLSQAGLK
jgi:adenylate cyclase